jgi:GNAT superfamily N-acetyltransferase
LTFREGRPGDLEAILGLIARADAQSGDWAPGGMPHAPAEDHDRRRLTERLAAAGQHNEVAEADGEVVGFLNAHGREDHWHLSYLFVDPAHQGRGVGARLLEHAQADAARRGHSRMTLHTPRLNARARRFYERAGWSATGATIFHEEIGLEMAEYALILPRHQWRG